MTDSTGSTNAVDDDGTNMTEIPHVDILDSIRSALLRAKERVQDGCIESGLLWAHDVASQPPLGHHGSHLLLRWFDDKRKSISRMKEIEEALTQLGASAHQLRVRIEKDCARAVSSHILVKLPDEILRGIFLETRGDWGYPGREIALVCRRFHSIIVNTAEFWARIEDGYSHYKIDLHLKRSKNAGLTIFILPEPTTIDDALTLFQSNVVRHTHRWVDFTFIHNGFGSDEEWRKMEEINRILRGLDVPMLRRFKLAYMNLGSAHLDPDNPAPPEKEVMRFFDSWTAPSLKEIVCENILLKFLPSSKPSLTSVDLKFEYDEESGEWAIRVLLEFLSQHPALMSIKLEIMDITDADENVKDPAPLVHLASLRELNIRAVDTTLGQSHDLPLSLEHLALFMQSLSTPCVEKLEIMLPYVVYELERFDGNIIEQLFPEHNSYSSLGELSLILRGDGEPDFSPLWPVFCRMTALWCLTLKCRPWGRNSVGFCRSLCVRRPDGLNADDAQEIKTFVEDGSFEDEADDISTESP